jgi:outer membrane protein OmpA-like peptidoglycan-associated protein
MISRTVVLVAFALWSIICWNWYVCGIKQACDERIGVPADDLTTGIEPDTLPLLGQPSPAPMTYTYPTPEDERVQIIDYGDHVEIHFPYRSARKEEDAAVDAYLSTLAQQLIASGKSVRLEGHADFVGGSRYNSQLGLQRARSIRSILLQKGVAEDQIRLQTHGDRRPIATNDTPEGRYRNRRVEIRVND